MSKARPILSSKLRVELLQRQGHKLEIKATNDIAEVEVIRADKQRHTVTITPNDIPAKRRDSQTFKRYPQSMLVAFAIHAACDWNDEQEHKKHLETVLAVDPSGCSCTLCRDRIHVALDRADTINIANILLGTQRNNTGLAVNICLEYSVAPDDTLHPHAVPTYVEARMMDQGNYRRYNIRPWWDQIKAQLKEK